MAMARCLMSLRMSVCRCGCGYSGQGRAAAPATGGGGGAGGEPAGPQWGPGLGEGGHCHLDQCGWPPSIYGLLPGVVKLP